MVIRYLKQKPGVSKYTEKTENTIKRIKSLLQNVEDKSKRIVLTGDFNSNIKWNNI